MSINAFPILTIPVEGLPGFQDNAVFKVRSGSLVCELLYQTLKIVCTDRLTPIDAATENIWSELITDSFTVIEAIGYLTNPTTTGTFTIDIKLNGSSILSTLLTIEAGDESSLTALTPSVISTPDFAKGDILQIDVTDEADGTGSGLQIYLRLGQTTPADNTPPSIPTGLALTVLSDTEIQVNYTAAFDNVGVHHYEIRLDGGAITNIGTANPYIKTGLTESTDYDFEIRAKDAAGNPSGWSSIQTATTEATPTLNSLHKIDCGRTSGGTVSMWEQDTLFSGGDLLDLTASYDLSGLTDPAPDAVYDFVRYTSSNFTYTFTGLEAAAPHKIRLHFSRADNSSRLLDVVINGDTVLDDYNVVSPDFPDADIQEFEVDSDGSGVIAIAFNKGATDNPWVSGIELFNYV